MVAQTNDTCGAIASAYGITVCQFEAWNPAVGADCGGLWVDEAYCVKADIANTTTTTGTDSGTDAAPAPTQSGIVANCQEYYVVKADNTCATIASAYGITVSQFEAWNPAVGADCGSLWLEEAYFVKAGTASSTSSTTSSAAASVTAPAPIQAGIPITCNAYDVAKDGDGCELFASCNGITVTRFCQSSSAYVESCSEQCLLKVRFSFWLGEAYCVGVSS
ncbi:uncharacterized protein N7458_003968 [Penicillium daleae]|uniref:LysM domain-containing protein n=1 Tax=Penicillium daleae TaxID=63821 RepID=A0AAD6CA29_9EURO|nr:uncharacterized protein N7458_003968 [Penicillium daleae]KAJ5455704.1 hypothetical protein N7458_003968 [Penicillium daleae]